MRSRARLFFAACVAIAAYFAYTAVSGAIDSHRLGAERDAAARELAELQEKKAYLEAVKQYVASDAYVEQEARRQLGYVRPGEVPFVVASPPLEGDQQTGAEWWERLFPR
jgi:cell division protein FtsB